MVNTTSSDQYSDSIAPRGSTGVLAIAFSVTTSGTEGAGDILNLCKYPAGYTPVLMVLKTDKAVASGNGTIIVGTNDGTTNDNDSILASTVATGALASINCVPATPTKSVGVTTVYATLGGDSGFSDEITASGVLFVSPFQV